MTTHIFPDDYSLIHIALDNTLDDIYKVVEAAQFELKLIVYLFGKKSTRYLIQLSMLYNRGSR